MLSFDPQLRTGADHGRDGQHPGKKPLLVIRDHCKFRQLLASCGKKNVPLCAGKKLCRLLRAFHIDGFPVLLPLRAKDTLIAGASVLTGSPDIFCHLCRIGMSGVQNDLRRFPSEKLLHIFGFQPSGADMEKFIFLQKGAAIFRGCTGIDRNMIFRKELTERIALGGPCKNNGFIHSYIPLVLPSCRLHS